MSYLTEDVIAQIKAARAAKGLSQRQLSQMVNIPQSYLSRIENGNVDIGLSGLINLARALELEIKLVPRHAVPTIDSIIRATTRNASSPSTPRPAYELNDDHDE